jgi:hypothetical protein
MRSSTSVSLYNIAHCNLLRSELRVPYSKSSIPDDAIIESAAVCAKVLTAGPVRAVSRRAIEQRSVQKCSHCRIESAAIWRLPDQTGWNTASSAAFM